MTHALNSASTKDKKRHSPVVELCLKVIQWGYYSTYSVTDPVKFEFFFASTLTRLLAASMSVILQSLPFFKVMVFSSEILSFT